MAAPEDWIGQSVRVGTETGGGPIIGTLEAVSDRGIVVRYEMMGEGERPMFIPWRLVNWAYPTGEDGS